MVKKKAVCNVFLVNLAVKTGKKAREKLFTVERGANAKLEKLGGEEGSGKS